MTDLDSARDGLVPLCTPGGRDALTLEVGHLHDLLASSERAARGRLAAFEERLEEQDAQLAKRSRGLKERAAALQWELRSLDAALGYSVPQNNVALLQQHWGGLQVGTAPLFTIEYCTYEPAGDSRGVVLFLSARTVRSHSATWA